MGQKVNPLGLRLNITRTWDSIWYANKDYSVNLIEDQKIRKFLKTRLQHAALSKIILERTGDKVRVKLFTARPGIIIGKKGSEIEILKKELEKLINRKAVIDIQEVRRP
ncbi:MAG TPA: 30S ribosomal protein S3, partial [Desulfobacterales bacterium]|nr:30S ribosomal protein S3 [Desulfobacterales bacterium]